MGGLFPPALACSAGEENWPLPQSRTTLLLILSEFTFTMSLRNSVLQAREADSSAGVSSSGWVAGHQEDEASAVWKGVLDSAMTTSVAGVGEGPWWLFLKLSPQSHTIQYVLTELQSTPSVLPLPEPRVSSCK